MTVYQVTVDTTIPYEKLEPKEEQDRLRCVQELTRLVKEQKLELFVSRRIRNDIPRDPYASKVDALLSELRIEETGSVTRVPFVVGQDKVACATFSEAHERYQKLAKQRHKERTGKRKAKVLEWADWDHLQRHYLDNRDAFLTWDCDFLSVRPELRQEFGIVVQKPEEFLNVHFNFESKDVRHE